MLCVLYRQKPVGVFKRVFEIGETMKQEHYERIEYWYENRDSLYSVGCEYIELARSLSIDKSAQRTPKKPAASFWQKRWRTQGKKPRSWRVRRD